MIHKLPDKKYDIIMADPAWDYFSRWKRVNSDSSGGWGWARDHYNEMNSDDIKKLPVNKISNDNSFLFMWATFPQIQLALDVIRDWGFEYKTVAFTWIKKNKNGKNFMGMGWYTRANAEVCLLAKKGKPKVLDHSVKQVIESVREKHSKKPDEVRDRIVRLCGDLPRIELFAREKVDGWDSWGLEVSD